MKKIRSIAYIVITSATIIASSSCDKSNTQNPDAYTENRIEISGNLKNKIYKITKQLYKPNFSVKTDDVKQKVFDLMGIKSPSLRSTYIEKSKKYIYSKTASTTLSQMMEIDPSEYYSKKDYTDKLLSIIKNNEGLTEEETIALEIASYVSADLIELKYGNGGIETELRSKWWNKTKEWCKKQWDDWGKCASGVVGSAGGGALYGAAAGSAVPAIGTVAGGIAGGISGGLIGVASFC